MPYVKQQQRARLDPYIWQLIVELVRMGFASGDVSYALTQVLLSYVKYHGKCYKTLKDVGGILSYTDKEFYRKVVAPYEDKKAKENGEVFDEED